MFELILNLSKIYQIYIYISAHIFKIQKAILYLHVFALTLNLHITLKEFTYIFVRIKS